VEGPDTLEIFDVCGRDLGELRVPLRALAAAIGVPFTRLGRIRGIFEESVCTCAWQLKRSRVLIEYRDENSEGGNKDSNADQAPLACTPSSGLVECRSDQNRQDEEDEGAD